MNKKLLLGLFLMSILIGALFILNGVQEGGKEGGKEEQGGIESNREIIDSEKVGENAQILTIKGESNQVEYTGYDINYSRDNRIYRNYFESNLRQALGWINENTKENSTFLCWWDYGHMIRGYSGRDVIIYSPSEDILYTLASKKWNEEGSGDFSSREKIDDVVLALVSTDPKETREVMEKYNAEYVFVATEDKFKSYVLFLIAGYDPSEYLVDGEPTKKAMEIVIFRMIDEQTIEGFELVYSDEYAKIYRK